MYLILFFVICLRLFSLSTVCGIDQGLKLFLVEAALERNLEVLRWLVRKEAFINIKDDNGLTPLMHASTMDDPTEVMQVLLAEGADADLRDDEGKTALHFASEKGNQGAVELLVAKMKNTSITDNMGRTALHLAVNSDNGDVLSYLIDQGLDYNVKDINGYTAFHVAAMIGKTKMIEIMKNRKIDLDLGTTNRTTPLMLASWFDHYKAAEYLIQLGSNINSQDHNNWTALHSAAYSGNIKLIKLLVENDANLDIRNSDGLTPLHLAVNNGHYAPVEYLLDKGADIYNTDNNNNTLLHGAAASGNNELLKHLTEKIHELNKLNGLGYTPLIVAALEGNQDAVKFLTGAGADTGILKILGANFLLKELSVNNTNLLKSLKQIDGNFEFSSKDSQGMTLLHYASRRSNNDTMKYLIDAMVEEHLKKIGSKIQIDQTLLLGADICLPCFNNITNIRDNEGKTPLHHAATGGNVYAINILLKHGADQRFVDINGLTAFHVAAKLGRTDVLKILAPHNSDINLADNQAKSALFLSTQEGKLDSLQYLINLGADLTIKDSKGWSLLHTATANGHNIVVQELLRHEHFVSEINDVDIDDKPPSWYAINLGRIDILETLELNGARIIQDNLCEAVENNNVEIVKYLTRKNGAQAVRTCFNGKTTLLHIAATKGQVNLLKHLIKYSCLVNSLDKNNKSSLWYAVNEQKWDCSKELKEAGGVIKPLVSSADAVRNNLIGFVKYFVKEGVNFPLDSLHEPAGVCNITIVKELVKISSLVNARNRFGRTPLWYAITGGHWDCVDVIERAGGEVKLDYTLEEAVKNNHLTYVKYLIRKGASVNSKALDGLPLVYWSAVRGYTDIVEYFLDSGADIESRHPSSLDSMVIISAHNSKCDTVKLLLRKGAFVNTLNENGETALDVTKPECRQDLINYGAKTSRQLYG